MARTKYEKWTVHSWVSPEGHEGAEIADGADGVTYYVGLVDPEEQPPQIATLRIVSPEGAAVDRASLRSIPVALLGDFARAQVRQQRALPPEHLLVDLRHHGDGEGSGATLHPDDEEKLAAFAAFYNSLDRMVPTGDGRMVARRDFIATEHESPYSDKSYSWMDKRIARAKAAGLIGNDTTSGGKASPGKKIRKEQTK